MTKPVSLGIISIISLIAIITLFSISPISQDLAYHNFADKRAWLGITNFGDVTGNFPFIVFGLMGVVFVSCNPERFTMKGERFLWQVFFIGAVLVGFGSGYYHLNPNNHTLVWDRLPMTIAFMSFFALVIMEYINEKAGLWLFPLLLVLGAGSVFYWDYTESLGRGDLRPYALVQFLPLLIMPLIFWLFPARYAGLKYLGYTIIWYVVAKVLEHFDSAVFALTHEMVSGHTLKHIAASFSIYTLLLYVKKRSIL